jgi:hypothetical protein
MAVSTAAKDKKSFVAALIKFEPRIDATSAPGIAADYIYSVCNSAKSVEGRNASEIKKASIDKLVSLSPRIKLVDDAVNSTEFIYSLFEENVGSSAASDSEDSNNSYQESDTATTAISSRSSPTAARSTTLPSTILSSTTPSSTILSSTPASSAPASSASASSAPASSASASSTPASSTAVTSTTVTPPTVTPPAVTPPAVTPPAVTPPAVTQLSTPPHTTTQQVASSSPTPTQPVGPLYTSDQLNSSPYRPIATYTPILNERVPPELKPSIGRYSNASFSVSLKLIKHGGRDQSPHGNNFQGVPKVQSLRYFDFYGKDTLMVVQRREFEDHNRYVGIIPYIFSGQYRESYNSMVHRPPDNWRAVLDDILADLEVAIVDRAAVRDWYLKLPANDPRFAVNRNHEAFLETFEEPRNTISRALSTNKLQLIRR